MVIKLVYIFISKKILCKNDTNLHKKFTANEKLLALIKFIYRDVSRFYIILKKLSISLQ
jgi:hypothetical protein